jgi:hypothetical protein
VHSLTLAIAPIALVRLSTASELGTTANANFGGSMDQCLGHIWRGARRAMPLGLADHACRAPLPLCERPRRAASFRHSPEGDTLVVRWVDRLGRNYEERNRHGAGADPSRYPGSRLSSTGMVFDQRIPNSLLHGIGGRTIAELPVRSKSLSRSLTPSVMIPIRESRIHERIEDGIRPNLPCNFPR